MKTDFGSLETIEEINEKLLSMMFEELTELLAVYQCPVGELAAKIAKAKGLKDSQIAAGKKKEQENIQNIALCQIAYFNERLVDEKIRSDKVLEGLLKDINYSIDRIAEALVWKINNIQT